MKNEYDSETVRTALKAAFRAAGLRDLVVTDDDNDTLYVHHYNGKSADLECDDKGVIVIRLIEGTRYIKTISGPRENNHTFFYVWYPQYDSGDTSVGIDPFWYTDDTDAEDSTCFQYVEALGEEIALYYVKQNIAYAMENDLMDLEYQRASDFDDYIFS